MSTTELIHQPKYQPAISYIVSTGCDRGVLVDYYFAELHHKPIRRVRAWLLGYLKEWLESQHDEGNITAQEQVDHLEAFYHIN